MAIKFKMQGKANVRMQGQPPSLQQLQEITERVAKEKFAQHAEKLKEKMQSQYALESPLKVEQTATGFAISAISKEMQDEMRLIEFGNEDKNAKPVWRGAMAVQKVQSKSLANEIKAGILRELK